MRKSILLSSLLLSSVFGLEWKDYSPKVPVAGYDTGTGLYVRKRNTGYTDTYANFFGGSVQGSYWEGMYRGGDPKFMKEFQGLSYNGSFTGLVTKLTVRSEGWSTLESGDSRWYDWYYSAMMPTGNNEYTLHATNKCVNGSCDKETNNPYLYVKNGDTLIIGNGKENTGLVFDWKVSGYSGEPTLDTEVGIDVRGMLLSNIKLQQDGDQPGKSVLNMKVTGNGSFKGLVDVSTRTSGTVDKLHVYDYAYKFDELWEGRNGVRKNDYHKVELSSNGDQDVSGFNADFVLRNTSSTLFYLTGQYRGGRSLKIHAENGAKYILKSDTKPVTVGTLSVGDNSMGIVSHLVNLTIDNLAFGVWDKSIGVISGGNTKSGYIGIESRANLTINNFRGNTASDGSNPSVVDLKDRKGVAYFLHHNLEGVNWKLGVNNNTTLNLYGTKNIFKEVYGVDGNKHLNVHVLSGDKTIVGIDTLRLDVLNSNGMSITTVARGRGKSDIFYVKGTEIAIDGSANRPTGTISLIPTIGTQDDRKKVIGEVVGYTPNGIPGFVKEFNWNPNNGVLNKGFKIVLNTFKSGNHTGWMIDKYILLGVDDVIDPPKPPEPEPEPPIDPQPPINPPVDPEPDPKPPVDPNPPITPPDPEPEPEPTPPDPGPGGGEGEKPVDPTPPVTPPEGGDGNGGTKPPEPEKPVEPDQPVQPDLPPVVPEIPEEKPDPKPEEKPDEKPKPPVVENESVFTETFRNAVSARVEGTRSLFLVNFNSINKRLGELRNNDNEHGVWTRGFVGGYDNTTFWTIQVGYDNQVLRSKDGSLYIGTAGSYSKDSLTDMGEVALYVSYIQDSGWYNDTIVKFAMMNSKSVVKNFNHYGVVLSDEIGYRFNIGGWFIDPQVEIALGYLTGADFKDLYTDPVSGNSSIVDASFSNTLHLRTRFGSSVGYNYVNDKENLLIQAYAGLFGEVDKFSKSKGVVGAYGFKETYGAAYTDDIRMVLNVGTNINMKDNGRIYLDFEKSFLGKFNIDWKVNVGYRYAFGKKEVKKDEVTEEDKKEDVTPVKLKDQSKKEVKKTAKGKSEKKVASK